VFDSCIGSDQRDVGDAAKHQWDCWLTSSTTNRRFAEAPFFGGGDEVAEMAQIYISAVSVGADMRAPEYQRDGPRIPHVRVRADGGGQLRPLTVPE
jgi:hypothetical protein